MKETPPSNETELFLKYIKKTKKPYVISSKKERKKVLQYLHLRAFLHLTAKKVWNREINKEILFLNILEVWYRNLVRNNIKGDVSIKEFISNAKNFEEYERKFSNSTRDRRKGNFRSRNV